MEGYSVVQWFAFFVTYCFLGWCIESLIVSVSKRKLVNRGFLRGPVLPLYGSGAVIMLMSTIWVKDNIVLVYVLGAVGATLLELVTGAAMEAVFKMRYWDYSGKKFNFKGYISLKSTLFWGVLTVCLVYLIHPSVSETVLNINQDVLGITALVVCVMMTVDTVIAFKGAVDIQKFLDYQTRIRQEADELTLKVCELKEGLSDDENGHLELISFQEERIKKLRTEIDDAKVKLGGLRRAILKGFPSATSKKFYAALEDIKEKIKNWV